MGILIMNTKKSISILSKYFSEEDFIQFLDNKYTSLNKKETLRRKFINFIYFDRGTGILNKREKAKLWNIKTDYLSALKLLGPNFTDKSILNQYVRDNDKQLYKKFFMKQFDMNNINN